MFLTDADRVTILGVTIENRSRREAMEILAGVLAHPGPGSTNVFIVNAHTLNLASRDEQYRRALCDGQRVFGDGTGVRWAARLRGVRMRGNLVGTDLVPALMDATANRGYRFYLLGGDEKTALRAAENAMKRFEGWHLAGFHHGYIAGDERGVIDRIHAAAPDLLLVGMGNPLQEAFLWRHRESLQVPLCIGVGGLFDHWAGSLVRAPLWVRRGGFEWLQLLQQQPHKWKRYVLGNPEFLWRVVRDLPRDWRVAGSERERS